MSAVPAAPSVTTGSQVPRHNLPTVRGPPAARAPGTRERQKKRPARPLSLSLAGMRRSIRLLRPRTWSTVAVALVGGFLASVLGQVLGVIPQSIGLAIGGDRGGWVLLAVGGVLTSLVTTPLVAIISTLVYFDGRIRHEGFDLEVMAADMARTAPST